MAEIVKRIFQKETCFQMTIFEDFLLTFEIGNSRDVENNFPEQISHDLSKSNHFKKIGIKKRE